jgi:hypothetical protein
MDTMSPTHPLLRPVVPSRRAARLAGVCVLCAMLPLAGCVNVLTMTLKTLKGDPITPAAYGVRNNVDLTEGNHTVAVIVDAPYSALNLHDNLTFDLQDGILRRFRKHDIVTADADEVSKQLEDRGGHFDPTAIAQNLDVDLIIHVQVETLTDTEEGTDDFYRGRGQVLVRAFEVRGEFGASDRHVVETFQQDVLTIHPSTYPLPADQTPRPVFLQKFVDQMADDIAHMFYDVPTASLF